MAYPPKSDPTVAAHPPRGDPANQPSKFSQTVATDKIRLNINVVQGRSERGNKDQLLLSYEAK